MRAVFGSVVVQASSSAAVVAAALLVASQMGLAAQGEFALLRSWSDALVTIAVLGLPQGLLHLTYRDAVPIAVLGQWVRRYVLVLFVLCATVGACVVFWAMDHRTGPALSVATAGLIAASVPFAAAHTLWRSLLLRHAGAIRYAFITAIPAWLILIGLLPVCHLGLRDALAWPLLGSAVGAAVISGVLVQRAGRNQPAAVSASLGWSRQTLWRVSIETGAQNVLIALSPAMVMSCATWAGASLAQIGAVSLGLHVYQLFGVGAAYLAPMFYDRVARTGSVMTNRQLRHRLLDLATWQSGVGIVTACAVALLVVRLLWPKDADSWALLMLMALAGILSMAVRLLITLMLARGVFRPLTFQAMARLMLSVGGSVALMQTCPAMLAVPLALALTEVVVLGWLIRLTQATDSTEPVAAGSA